MRKQIGTWWYYHKWHVAIACLVLLIGGSLIRSWVDNGRQRLLCMATVNLSDTTLASEMLERAYQGREDVDVGRTPLQVQGGLYQPEDMAHNTEEAVVAGVQKFSVMLTNGAFDLVLSPSWSVELFSASDAYQDLSQVLPEKLYARVEGQLYWAACADGVSRPVGIVLNHPEQWGGVYAGTTQILTIPSRAQQVDEAVYVLQWLLEETMEGQEGR